MPSPEVNPDLNPADRKQDGSPQTGKPDDALHKDANSGSIETQRAAQSKMRASPSKDSSVPKESNDAKDSSTNGGAAPPGELNYSLNQIIARVKRAGGDAGKLSPKIVDAFEDNLHKADQVAHRLAKMLVKNGIELPPGCPVKIETDKSGNFESNKGFLSRVGSSSGASIDKTENNKQNSNYLDADELVSKLAWIQVAQEKLHVTELDAQISLSAKRITAMGDSVKGWLPPAGMSLSEKEKWLQKVSPWLNIARTAETYYKACEDINKASDSSFFVHYNFSRLGAETFKDVVGYDKDFPGKPGKDALGESKANLTLPETLERSEANLQKMKRLEEWINKVADPLNQVMTEFVASTSVRNPARICSWEDEPLGKDETGLTADNQSYNNKRRRFTAEPVKILIKDADGEHFEDRIKVTTSIQKQWRSDASYNGVGYVEDIGRPETSGFATAKILGTTDEFKLEPNKAISIGSQSEIKIANTTAAAKHAQVRLTDDGRLQVLSSSEGGGTYIIKAASLNKEESKVLATANEWVDLDPGDKLQIGDRQIAFANDTRLYRPTDWVAIKGNTGELPMQAKGLQAWALEARAWEVTGTVTSFAMDVGFVVTGALETGVMLKVGLKEGGWSMARNAAWHLGLGGSGIGQQLIENNLGKFGKGVLEYRGYAMVLDVAATSGFGWARPIKNVWGTFVGEANEAAMAKVLAGKHGMLPDTSFLLDTEVAKAPLGQTIKGLNDRMLQISGVAMLPELAKGFAQGWGINTSALAKEESANQLINKSIEKAFRLPPIGTAANRFMSVSDTKTQEIIQKYQDEVTALQMASQSVGISELQMRGTGIEGILKPETFKEIFQSKADEAKENENKHAQVLAEKFGNSKDPVERLASILALMKLRQQPDGSMPESLATYKTKDQKQQSISLLEAESFLAHYKPVHLSKSGAKNAEKFDAVALQNQFVQFTSGLKCSKDNAQIIIDGTKEALSLPMEQREKQIDKLAAIYLSQSNPQDTTAAAMALLLLNADDKGNVSQRLCQKGSWDVSILDAVTSKKRASMLILLENDPKQAEILARQKFGENNLGALLQRDSARPEGFSFHAAQRTEVTSSLVVDYLRKQLGEKESGTYRLALADALHNMGQLSNTKLGGICQDVINDKDCNLKEKADAMLDNNHARLLELLPNQRYVAERIIQNRNSPLVEREKMAEESLGRNSQDLQESLLSLARNSKEDPDLRTLALSVLHVSNIKDPQLMDQAMKSLKEQWKKYSSPEARSEHLFAKSFLEKCQDALNTPQDALSSFASRQKVFEAALSIHELGEVNMAVDPTLQQKALTGLLHCLRTARETADTIKGSSVAPAKNNAAAEMIAINAATVESQRMAEQIVPLLGKEYKKLSATEKTEFQQKCLQILNWPTTTKLSVLQTKLEVIGQLDTLLKPPTAIAKEELTTSLKGIILAATTLERDMGFGGIETGARQANSETGVAALIALSKLDRLEKQKDTLEFLEKLVIDKSTSSALRHAALAHLAIAKGEHLERCLTLLASERDPLLRSQLESIKAKQERQDPQSDEYQRQRDQAKSNIKQKNDKVDNAAVRDYINSHFWHLVADDFSNARRNTRSPQTHSEEEVVTAVRTLEEKAKAAPGDSESKLAQEALSFIVSSNGRPFFDRHRAVAVKTAANSLFNLCKEGSAEIKNAVAPLVIKCATDPVLMPREARQTLVNAITWLDPGSKDSPLTRRDAAEALALALEEEHKRLPTSLSAPDYKDSQDYQLHLLDLLSRYAGPQEIPLLAAIVEEERMPSVELDENKQAIKVEYPNKTGRSVERKGDDIIAFTHWDADGKVNERWEKDQGAYYSSTDKTHTNPWYCRIRLEPDGSFVISDSANTKLEVPYECYVSNDRAAFAKAKASSAGGTIINTYGTETTFLASGSKIERSELGTPGLSARWICITYPDGSQRSRVIDSNGKGLGKLVYRANSNDQRHGASTEVDPMQTRPAWLPDPLKRGEMPPGDYDHIDYATGAVLRRDRDTLDNKHVVHLTTLHANGQVDCDRFETTTVEPFTNRPDPNQGPTTRILQGRSFEDNSSHPMPLVREKAKAILTQLNQHESKGNTDLTSQRVHDRYETAKNNIRDKALRPLIELGESWFRKNDKYPLLDGETLGQIESSKAQNDLWLWQRPFYSPDFEGANQIVHKKMEDQFKELVLEAQGKDNPDKNSPQIGSTSAEARAALAYIILSGGRPFRSEADRVQAMQLAADGILEVCKNKSPGAGEMASIVSGVLISDPTISTSTRHTLFLALKEMVGERRNAKDEHAGTLTSTDIAPAVVAALEAEYKTMPPEYLQNRVRRWENPAFKESEKLQMDLLAYLKTTNYKGNMAQLEALAERSSSISVKHKAKELLRHFDSVSNLDFVAQAQIKPAEKATAIGTILKDKNASEDRIVQTIISNCDTPFVEDGNRINDPRAEMLLEAMRSSIERIRVAAARGYTYCSSRSYIETPEELLLTVYDLSKNGKRLACKEEAASLLTPLTWKYKFDPNGDLWASKIKPRLDELLKHKYSSDIASAKDDK